MVKGRRFPDVHRMTRYTIVRELARQMAGALDIIKVHRVAGETICRQRFELSILVARQALYALMRSLKRKCRIRMIKRGWFPNKSSVASRTIMGEHTLEMARILNSVIVALMARVTICRQRFELSVLVAR